MSGGPPRLRMFAGPNGSGKTTVKNGLPPTLFRLYINPDEIEQTIRATGELQVHQFGLTVETSELREWFTSSDFLKANRLEEAARVVEVREGVLSFRGLEINSYYASVLSDYLRRKLLAASNSFTFETVMSSPDKVEFLREAQRSGFRTYLYYVATENPEINVERVSHRVQGGGHSVPVEKVIARYERSLHLLRDAIRYANRAYFFDTSRDTAVYFAEITDGNEIDMKTEVVPNWFKTAVWDKF